MLYVVHTAVTHHIPYGIPPFAEATCQLPTFACFVYHITIGAISRQYLVDAPLFVRRQHDKQDTDTFPPMGRTDKHTIYHSAQALLYAIAIPAIYCSS